MEISSARTRDVLDDFSSGRATDIPPEFLRISTILRDKGEGEGEDPRRDKWRREVERLILPRKSWTLKTFEKHDWKEKKKKK